MEYLDGEPLNKGLMKILRVIAEQEGKTPAEFAQEQRELIRKGDIYSLERRKWQFWLAKWKYGIPFNPAEYLQVHHRMIIWCVV